MLKAKMHHKIATAVLTFSSLMLPLSAEASNFTGLNVFGDSLVETGNLFNVTGLPPNPPYFNGRFSNDKIWVDILAEKFELNPVLSSQLETTIPTQGINFGFSSATTGFNNTASNLFPGLQQQINDFQNLTAVVPVDVNNSLNIIWAGANDYLQVFSDPDSLTFPITELPKQATDNLSGAVQSLYNVGARNFLVVNLPNIGDTPFANFLDGFAPGASSQLNNFTTAHNFLLEQKLNTLTSSLSGIDITTLDANSLFLNITTKPSQFGFTNVNNSCLVNFQPIFRFDGVCNNPNEFVFWDDIHPTAAVHQLIAEIAIDTLEEKERVPEPNSIWSLSLFALLSLSWVRGYKCDINR